WDPAGDRAKYEADGSDVFRMSVTGHSAADTIPGAGPFVSRTVAPSIRTGGAGAEIGVNVLPARAKDAKITWSVASPAKAKLVKLSTSTGDSVTVTGSNSTNKAEWVPVRATAPNGFYVQAFVYVEPRFIDAPSFVKQPVIAAPIAGKVSVRYTLDLAKHPGLTDESLITWSQCEDAQCANPRKVAVSRGDEPLKTYTLTPGDVGKYLQVSIEPKHNISDPGAAVTVVSAKPVTKDEVPSQNVNPNFRNFVEAPNADIANGEWTVTGTFTSVTGDNLVNGYGVRVSNPPGAAGGAFGGGAARAGGARASA